MASNISVADIMSSMNGSSSSTTPTNSSANTDISVESILNSLGMTQEQ